MLAQEFLAVSLQQLLDVRKGFDPSLLQKRHLGVFLLMLLREDKTCLRLRFCVQ